MKNLISKLFVGILFISLVTSCEDSDKNPLIQSAVAPFVKFEPGNLQFDLGNVESSSIGGTFFSDVPELVASHTISMALDNGVNSLVFVELMTITELPFEFSATLPELAPILGVNVEDIAPGQSISFQATTVGVDGTVIEPSNVTVAGETTTVAQQQGYFFDGVAICPPFEIDAILGTYNVIANSLAPAVGVSDPDPTREVIAGPGPNQITVVGGSVGFAGGDDLIIDVNTENGDLSLGLDADGSPGLAFPVGTGGLTFDSDYAPFPAGATVVSCVDPQRISLGLALTCCAFVGTFELERQ